MQQLRRCFLMPAGLYISIPFCRSKCTYCNFASGVFSAGQMSRYVERICEAIASFRALAKRHAAVVPDEVDSIYLGGGTPSLLPAADLKRLFSTVPRTYHAPRQPELTVDFP